MKKFTIAENYLLGCNVNNYNYNEILSHIRNSIINKKLSKITYINSYVALIAYKNQDFQQLINSFLLYTDGIGMYYAKKLLFGRNAYWTIGTEFHSLVLEVAVKNKFSVFFFGGDVKVCKTLLQKLKLLYPALTIAGIVSRDSYSDNSIIEKINSTESDILFVGLGTPLQEEWIVANENKLNIPVKIAVGSGIDYLAGTYKRAPKIMREFGLEWLFRLLYDPKRLWRRYILGIPYFIYLVIKEYFKKRRKDD